MICFFVALSGKVGNQKRLIFDFGPEEGNLGDFIEEINLNQRDQGILASVKRVLDGQEGVELDNG